MLTAPPDLPAAEIPLQAPGTTGALSLYAAAPHAFGAAQISRATIFACYLPSALVIGARQDGLLATIDQLRTALASRAVIDQAIGVIMTRDHCGSSQAVAMLRAESQHRNLKLRDLARQIVTEASGGPPQLPPFETGPQPPGRFPAARPEAAAAENDGQRQDRRRARYPRICPRQAVTSARNGIPAAERSGAVFAIHEVAFAEAAYEGGLAALRAGPFGGARGLSKLVRLRFAEPVQRVRS